MQRQPAAPQSLRPAPSAGERQGTHGGEIYRLARRLGVPPEAILDFSSNANSLCDDLTGAIIRGTEYPYRHYPDSWSTALRERLAVHEGVSPESIIVGNGSSENIFLAIQQLQPEHVLLVAPIFSEYVRACEAFGVPHSLLPCRPEHGFDLTEHELDALRRSDADMVILCSPNNPACITYPAMKTILGAIRARTVLIDNTYSEFLWGLPEHAANRYASYLPLMPRGTELITVQSFTKFFYCTGIRLGYAMASEPLATHMASGKTPWSVSAFAEQTGLAFLDAMGAYRERLPALREERTRFTAALRATGVFTPEHIFEGVNFVTAQLTRPEQADDVYNALLAQGMLVRVCDNIPGMPPGFIRMQVREEAAWLRLTDALAALRP